MSDWVITPEPTAEEAAAIAAAHEVLWPRPPAAQPRRDEHLAWRFSGRWWVNHRRPLRQQAR